MWIINLLAAAVVTADCYLLVYKRWAARSRLKELKATLRYCLRTGTRVDEMYSYDDI